MESFRYGIRPEFKFNSDYPCSNLDTKAGANISDIETESRASLAILHPMAKGQHDLGYKSVLKLLREMREEAGLTQRAMAEKVRKPQPWVHKSETGERRLDVNEFLIWCKACNADSVKAFARFVGMR